ncbi:MAG TPA: hypothetical protein VMN36_08330 [Verrucomicrobiales bacterium]|nr:hypothetical protein [Verrucomicrobiales bacterium]
MKVQHLRFALLALLSGSSAFAAWKVIPGDEWSKEVRVWDPAPELNLSFRWSGDTNSRHEAEGVGSLEWILPGDDYQILSRYSGTMKAGKREGKGVWLHRSGSKYDGEWKDNVKHGDGEYWLGSGEYYKGEFQNDRMHGQGLWIGLDGFIYDGGFLAGKKHGHARLTMPGGAARDSLWEDDREVDPPPAAANLKPNIQLALDRSQYAFTGEVAQASDECEAIEYLGRPSDGTLVVEPDWSVWSDWNRGGPVGISDADSFGFEVSVFPVFLEIRLFNPSAIPLSIVSAEIEGEESHPDLEPLLVVEDAGSHAGSVLCAVLNLKDSQVDSCEISYNLQPLKEKPGYGDYRFKETLPPFRKKVEFSIAKAVDSLGIDSEAISMIDAFETEWNVEGEDYDYEKRSAQEELIRERVRKGLGSFAKHAGGEDGSLVLDVRVVGEMTAGWTDHLGNPASRTVKVNFLKTLCSLWPEYGAGGPVAGKFDVTLPVSAKNYATPFPYRKTVAANGAERFTLRMVSGSSSRHAFRIRLTAADGTRIVSQPCKLTYLVPAGFSWENGFVLEELE